jgi:2-dehydro-3-deoxy-D-arabinonate dehydratase
VEIVRYADRRDRQVKVGVRTDEGVRQLPVTELAELLRLTKDELRSTLDKAGDRADDPLVLPPIDGRTELWASGVTYERSRDARVEETTEKSVYERVYDAERPELFLKAVAWRVVTDGEPVAIRADSGLDVPEPEFGVVANSAGEIVGYVVCNDMSSRSIEGENPLYLPQAKIYAGSAAISTGIKPAWEIDDPQDLAIALEVDRGGDTAWRGETSTARMHRTPDELVDYLFRGDSHPDGAILSTGTGIIPELSFTLQDGDVVRISIDQVGTLTNRVVVGKDPLAWLVTAINDPFAREAAR